MKGGMSIDAIMFLVFVFGILIVNGGPGRTTTTSAEPATASEAPDVGGIPEAIIGERGVAASGPIVVDGG